MSESATRSRLEHLEQIQRKLLWLSAWAVHHANHVRPNRDGLQVGGHQASCASVAAIMTALYFDVLRPQDRVAVKPHAGPVFHAANLLLGRQTVDQMARLRSFGGAQPYPSRVKDGAEVDFSSPITSACTASPTCRPAGWSPSPAMRSWTRATSTRRCSKAGSTTCDACAQALLS